MMQLENAPKEPLVITIPVCEALEIVRALGTAIGAFQALEITSTLSESQQKAIPLLREQVEIAANKLQDAFDRAGEKS